MGVGIQQQEEAPEVTPARGQKGPVTALGRRQRGLGPVLGGDGR